MLFVPQKLRNFDTNSSQAYPSALANTTIILYQPPSTGNWKTGKLGTGSLTRAWFVLGGLFHRPRMVHYLNGRHAGWALFFPPSHRTRALTKHDLLTETEFAGFVPNKSITRSLEAFAAASGRAPGELRVLDWGCGRGRQVLWLRQQGYQAYGVEVDPLPVENGLPLLESYGYADRPLALLDADGRSPYEHGFFDYVLSGNVLEHVADLEQVCAEMARVTRAGGGGYHVFPAQRQVVEGHLFMPFVHWLPPGRLRKLLIRFWVLLGREPHWVEVRDASPRARWISITSTRSTTCSTGPMRLSAAPSRDMVSTSLSLWQTIRVSGATG